MALEYAPPKPSWWSRIADSSVLMGVGFALAAVMTGAAVVMGSSLGLSSRTDLFGNSQSLDERISLILIVLVTNLVLILVLTALMAWRMLRLLDAQPSDAGARLHLRFVTQFALAAVAPAVIVAIFFGVLVTRGVDSWFSQRVQTVVENSATVARSYVDERMSYIAGHVSSMAQEVNRAAPAIAQSPIAFSHYLADLAADNGFDAAYIIDKDGRVLARADTAASPPFVAPPASTIAAADTGDVSVHPFERDDLMRALFKLREPDSYLYVVLRIDRGILGHLRETEGSLVAYREARDSRARIQAAFALSYLETALLVLLGAVWLGMTAASRIALPVARLVQAAGKVAGGDLSARVDGSHDPAEIAVLSQAFNSMTTDLQVQQDALKRAGEEADSRREFIEAVLLGVSAGVIGLDAEKRISALNKQAATLLALRGGAVFGRTLAEVAPELEGVADRALEIGSEAEEDVDVIRGTESLRLRVRAGPSPDGLVLTFDDITRLITAQRNAAWKDVARRIAHEIKNPLTPIQLSAERLRRKYRKEITHDLETFDRCTETIIRQVGDIGRMVDEFSAFARMPAPKFAAVDAAELLRAAVFAQRVADPDVAVEIAEPLPELDLLCDGRMVGQALANILKNAGEAIATRRALSPLPPGKIIARLVLDGRHLRFEAEDNGVGLPDRDRDRLTEPYVTTREKGTGLGLAIVKRILEDHGGELTLTDAGALEGALVTLSFPATQVSPRPAPHDAAVTV